MAKLVTVNEMVSVFKSMRNGSFATINMLTDAKLKKFGIFEIIENGETVKYKKPCPFVNMRKRNRVQIQVGTNYESIMRKRTDNTEFEAEPIWGGKGEPVNRWLVRHVDTGELYFRFSGVNLQYAKPEYMVGDTIIDSESVKPYLLAKSSNPADWFMPKISSVKSITIGGEDYIITT